MNSSEIQQTVLILHNNKKSTEFQKSNHFLPSLNFTTKYWMKAIRVNGLDWILLKGEIQFVTLNQKAPIQSNHRDFFTDKKL